MKNNEHTTYFNFIRLLKLLSNCYDGIFNKVLCEIGLTSTQSDILHYLYQKPSGAVNTDELLCAFRIRPSSLSSILKKLEEKAYIHYKINQSDARAKQIYLSDKALTDKDIIIERTNKMYDKIFFGFSKSDIDDLTADLEKLLNSLSNQQKELLK